MARVTHDDCYDCVSEAILVPDPRDPDPRGKPGQAREEDQGQQESCRERGFNENLVNLYYLWKIQEFF